LRNRESGIPWRQMHEAASGGDRGMIEDDVASTLPHHPRAAVPVV